MPVADLEIGIHRWSEDYYAVEMRFDNPASPTIEPSVRDTRVKFDLAKLLKLANDGLVEDYGRLLTETIFTPDLQGMFGKLLKEVFPTNNDTEEKNKLRVRLFIAPSASDLSSLRWETLFNPETNKWMATSEDILFSRFLTSLDFKPVKLPSREKLKALVAIANPSNIEDYGLNEIDVRAQIDVAKSAFGDIPSTILAFAPVEAADKTAPVERATLNNILDKLREGYDIFYLVCHGAINREGPHLWLEDANGKADIVSGDRLVRQLSDIEKRPVLIALSTCQSAGTYEKIKNTALDGSSNGFKNEALIAIGPSLVRYGIPAVVAMQGKITVDTANKFFTKFFQYLTTDCLIDQAMAVGRGAVFTNNDNWMPTLFTRLKKGCMWYKPGFIGAQGKPEGEFEGWNALLATIRGGVCTPIIGSGLLEPFVGRTKEIANRLAESNNFPLSSNYQDDLPQVAQYLLVTQREFVMRQKLQTALARELAQRHGDWLSPDEKARLLSQVDTDRELQSAMNKVGQSLRQSNSVEPHHILAALPFPLYITTNPDGNMVAALKEVGKNPKVDYYRWKEELRWPDPISYQAEPQLDDPGTVDGYDPAVDNPLIYYLFGRYGISDSVVLSEDDFFDYLYGITKGTRGGNPLPPRVSRSLSDTALLFLGFQLEDWDFRVLFKSIMGQEGRRRRKRFIHVAVQINPEEGRTQDPDRARKYLEKKFGGVDVNIYWGSVEDFFQELRRRWNEAYSTNQI